jgi:hypothetical protein
VGHLGTGAGVHNRTDDTGRDPGQSRESGPGARGIETMFSTIAMLVAAAGGALMLYKRRAAGRVNPANLGWMSEQWLAENRSSHPS